MINAKKLLWLKSLKQPNTVDIRVNGVSQSKVLITSLGADPFKAVTLQLKGGRNTIEFVGSNPTGHFPADSRDLGIAISDLGLLDKNVDTKCVFQN